VSHADEPTPTVTPARGGGCGRPGSRHVLPAEKARVVRPVTLSGDRRATAERVAAELGIDEVIAEVLPADKAAKVRERQQHGAAPNAIALKRLRVPDQAEHEQAPPAAGAPGRQVAPTPTV